MSARYLGSVVVGLDEQPAFGIDWTAVGTPSSPTAVLLDVTQGYLDVSAAGLSGAASVAGAVVTLPGIVGSALALGHSYQLTNRVTVSGQPLSCYLIVAPEK